MFTGLVEGLGRVMEVTQAEGSTRIAIAPCFPPAEISRGESIAVDGVCLTAVALTGDRFGADVVAETLSRTTLGLLRPGSRVNLERSLRLGDRLGGHLVQGHVDTTAPVLSVRRRGDDYRLRVESKTEIRRFLAFKGSVALQGVSLTIAAVSDEGFEVALIPETLERTNLGDLGAGDRVNVEIDLMARYVEAMVRDRDGEAIP